MTTMFIINRMQTRPINRPFALAKRFVDIIISLMALPFLGIATLVVGLAIRLDSPGPIFFKQQRVGKGRQTFEIFKFRTMQHNCNKNNHKDFMEKYIRGNLAGAAKEGNKDVLYKPPIESQVTRVGRILRKTSIDELPQLWNVLVGEMSLVGPRPNVLWEVEAYESWHNERLEVKPGITGLAQVKGRSGIPFDELVSYDVEYVRKQGVRLDWQIMWDTFTVVFRGDGSG